MEMRSLHSCVNKNVLICEKNVPSALYWKDPWTVLREQVAQCSSHKNLHSSETWEHFLHSSNLEIVRKACLAVERYIMACPNIISVSWKTTKNNGIESTLERLQFFSDNLQIFHSARAHQFSFLRITLLNVSKEYQHRIVSVEKTTVA